MIKLIASDLDGTLLQNDAQALTPRAIDLISKLCDAGIHFVSASGRQYDNQKRVFDPLKTVFHLSQRMAQSACIREKSFPVLRSTMIWQPGF